MLEAQLRAMLASGELDLPLPGSGKTAVRHSQLAEFGRRDLALARLVEAHVDAVAILAEAGRKPHAGLYGVWAAETNGHPLIFDGATLRGSKMFCTGADFLDRALITAEGRLLDVSLRASAETISIDTSVWKTGAFAEARTATVTFDGTPVDEDNVICGPNWYIDRPGFWQGACGPSACWAGGAIALLDYALRQSRNDSHTLAHLAAMDADVWGLRAYLECAGNQIDAQPKDWRTAQKTALRMRHLIEQACVDILTRLGRAYGPRPLAFDETISRRYQELELYIRQCHAERDLEVLGSLLQSASSRGRAVFQEIA